MIHDHLYSRYLIESSIYFSKVLDEIHDNKMKNYREREETNLRLLRESKPNLGPRPTRTDWTRKECKCV